MSVAANIVEGSARHSRQEYRQFLYIGKASLDEVSYYFHLARRLEYLSDAQFHELNARYEETARTLYGLIQFVSQESNAEFVHA